MNLRKWQQLKRSALTQEHAYVRLTWAQTHRLYTYLNWRRVCWSDECSIQLRKGQKLEWVFIPGGKGQYQRQLQPDMVQPRCYGKQKSKMFWAAFGYGVCIKLVPMEGDPLAPRCQLEITWRSFSSSRISSRQMESFGTDWFMYI
jgi:hypothetical protein